MNKLVEEIIKPILEANSKIKKVVGIYGGRFQPFGPHHLKTYKWLTKQVDVAYITTSNIKKPPRHPMNFKEKVRHMSKMGVPSNKIIEEKSPYVAKNLEKKFDSETTAFVYVFGAKDAGRLGGKYFQDYKKSKGNIKGYKEHGYYLVAPHVSISVGGMEVSGTSMRDLLGSSNYDDSERVKLFKKMFGYYNKGIFQMMTNKFKKLFEDADMEFKPISMKYVPSKKKKLKKKWKDGKGQELLKGWLGEDWFKKGSKKDRELKLKISKLYSKAFKMIANSKEQLKVRKEIEKLRNQLSEGVDLPIEIGDTVRMGKFKNKKVVVKSIDWNEKGDLLINGRPALKFRIEKKDVEEGYPNEEDMKHIRRRVKKARSKSDSSKEYQYHEIDEFLIHNDISKIIKEASATVSLGKAMVDDGPSAFMGGMKGYAGRNKIEAEKLGWEVINYILDVDVSKIPPFKSEFPSGYPDGPHKSVSYMPAGIGTGITPNNQDNLTGRAGYNKWKKTMRSVAQEVGFKLMNFKQQKDDEKEISKTIASDSTQTLKQQKKDEKEQSKEIKDVKVEESAFSQSWWKDNLTEVSPKTRLFKQKLMRRGIKIRYDKAKAEKDLMTKYGGQGEVVGKKFGLRKAYYAVPKKGFKKDTKPVLKINKKEMEKLHQDKQLDKGNLKVVYTEGLLMEGGAYGHMSHPFDDKELTFGDLKKIIELGLGGQLNREDNVTEKLDGQNIMISWKNGKLIAARNKGHIKNGGKTALDAKGIKLKFKGRGDIANAFNFAMKDLEKAIKGLSQKQKDKIFNEGQHWMNMEVMWPKSANVIDYDVTTLIFHGALVYDDKGNVIGEVKGSGRILAGMIEQINQHIQKKYSIGKPNFLKVPKHQDFGKMKGKFLGKLQKLQNEFGLKDNDTLALYHQSYWERFIINGVYGKNYKVPPKVLKGLTKRWAFFDKSYSVKDIRNDIKEEHIRDWVLDFDKKNHAKWVKDNMKPFEILFFEVGAEILKNVKGFISANPKKSVRNMVKNLDKAIKIVQSGGDIKKLSRLKTQLDRLNAIGGTKAIVPSEGLVFKYKGKTYKFTGAFAPVNQITGLIYF